MRHPNTKERRRDREELVYRYRREISMLQKEWHDRWNDKDIRHKVIRFVDSIVRKQLEYNPQTNSLDIFSSLSRCLKDNSFSFKLREGCEERDRKLMTGASVIQQILAMQPGETLVADEQDLHDYFDIAYNPMNGETAASEMNKFFQTLQKQPARWIWHHDFTQRHYQIHRVKPY